MRIVMIYRCTCIALHVHPADTELLSPALDPVDDLFGRTTRRARAQDFVMVGMGVEKKCTRPGPDRVENFYQENKNNRHDYTRKINPKIKTYFYKNYSACSKKLLKIY